MAAIRKKRSSLTLTFAEPVDPTETPFLSVLVFFEKINRYLSAGECVHLLGMIPKQVGDVIAVGSLEDQSLWSKEYSRTAAINLSTVCTVIAFATNSDQQSGRAKKYSYK